MNRIFLVLSVLAASALLIPNVAEAQRGGRGGGGGARIGGGGFGGGGFRGGGGGFRGGNIGGGPRMYIPPRASMGSGGFRGQAIASRPAVSGNALGIRPVSGNIRQAAINNPGGRFDNRWDNRWNNRSDWRYRGRYPYYGGRYPYYGRYYGGYPYYGNYWGWGAGLVTGSVIGAAATYPYYNYPYSTYQTPVTSTSGGYCATTVRTCALINPAPVGTGCSCRTQGGRARGSVI